MALQLALQILGLFFMIFCGWLIVKIGILKAEDSKILSKIVIYLVNPFVIVGSFQVNSSEKIQSELVFSVLLSLSLHIVLLIVVKIFEKTLKLNNIEKASVMYSNSANMVIPIVIALFGQEYVIYSVGFFAVQLIFLWTHAKYTISEVREMNLRKIFLEINMVSIILGALLFLFQIKIPAIFLSPMNSIGSMMGPMSMIISGMLMTKLDVKKLNEYRKLPLTVFLRMAVVPLIIVVFMILVKSYFPLKTEEYIYIISLIAAITPTAATITQQCQIYNKDSVYSNTIYIITTLTCILTMPLLLKLFMSI